MGDDLLLSPGIKMS